MKKPDKTKSTGASDTAQDTAPLMLKKDAADPGVIARTDIGVGDGSAAVPKASGVKPVESTLLGDAAGQNPPAKPKAKADPVKTGAGPFDARPSGDGTRDAGPKDTGAKDPAPNAAPDDPAAQPVLRDTPIPVSATSSSQGAKVRKTGFWPVFLGGVVAAGLGSAATIWALPHLPAGWLPEQPAVQAPQAEPVDVAAIRADAVSAAQAASAEQIAALRAELAAQPQPDAPAEPAAEMPPAASAEDLAALRQQIEAQAEQIRELTERPRIDPETAQRVQALADQSETLEQQIQAAAQAAQAQINEAQSEAERLQQAAAETTRRAEAVAAVAALQTALDRGVNPDEARQTLEGAGLDAPEALTREVPGLDSLQAGFPEAARAALRASLRQDSVAGNGNLLTNFLRAQTGARSVEAREGSDPDAILSRADDAVQSGRIGDAVAEIEALPDPARTVPPMAGWLAGAMAYRDAQAALSDLSAPSN
ncbi:hypothetical protein EYF88_02425 [Paracoccus sediminis]|uniref:Uncharacterized conserved protein n=1 Tax=Paracoccus sediminis TaxID=1214787 RepID=A0A238UMP5_9RHOB|nr:hypothetical protein [Paracoccus sediminis]TBN53072.1 hypothetical protein EYF88_02425 [Paracoccus sediminis]SNR23298.1 Uncharacterized conserved protein [Paracoccus sediminis]